MKIKYSGLWEYDFKTIGVEQYLVSGEVQADVRRKNMPGRGNGKYKDLENRTYLVYLRTSREATVCHEQRRR